MILKSYTNFSDSALIDHLNGNIHYQLFCGIQIDPLHPLTNYKIVSAIRQELADCLDIPSSQQVLAESWKPYLENLHVCMTDATCYESYIRFPTDVKLLWESVRWLHQHLCNHCKSLRICRPRTKYADVSTAYLSYSKKRKRKQSRTRMLKRRLLKLLEKLVIQMEKLHCTYKDSLCLSADYQRRFSVIKTVWEQGKMLFAGKKVSDRIVSVDRHYIQPIIRGKETKAVEFGAKVNNIQIDGISFIEHISFKAFNKGIRLKDCIRLQQQLTRVRVRGVAADVIYANNENRKFCAKYGIITSFKRKGKAASVRYEEFFITAFDGDVMGLYDYLTEYENLDELNHLAHLISELDSDEIETLEAVLNKGDHTSSVADIINLVHNLDCYDLHPGVSDDETLGRIYVEDMELLDVPDNVLPYFDFEAYGRDMRINEGGHFAPTGYLTRSGGFKEVYHGIEDIPAEHRIFAYPKLNIWEQMAAYKEVIDRSSLEGEHLHPRKERDDR